MWSGLNRDPSFIELYMALSMNEKVPPYFHPLQFYVFCYNPDIAVPIWAGLGVFESKRM